MKKGYRRRKKIMASLNLEDCNLKGQEKQKVEEIKKENIFKMRFKINLKK